MPLLLTKVRTALALGVPNIFRVLGYTAGVRMGINPVRRLKAEIPKGVFFRPTSLPSTGLEPVQGWHDRGMLFSRWPVPLDASPPAWLANPFTGKPVADPQRPWWQIADFDPAVGDIKLIWELSRMDWLLAFAQRARNGDATSLARLNAWLDDWFLRNPPYAGPNWKCGQEASIRVMHFACAALMLGQVDEPSNALRDAVQMHLQRIAPTLQYAMAQDNNHGTSEAAALFIGGSWLAELGVEQAHTWAQKGRRWLENRAARLIGPQGSFSQYSLNYHRVMLDTFSLAEIWRRRRGLVPFSSRLHQRVGTAAAWLRQMTEEVNGGAPNVGANDGARLLQLCDAPYRDYRPSVQLASVLFSSKRAYAAEGTWNAALRWLDVPLPDAVAEPRGHYIADDGGFALLRCGAVMAMLRYPRFRFRPSQADALHLDLWVRGQNVLRDAGTYSYNTDPATIAYFGGTEGHNTVQFDGRDQMPRLSRFLFGDWLKTRWIEPLQEDGGAACFSAGYRDSHGAMHRRRMVLSESGLRVEDELDGPYERAVLRWRLAPGEWQLSMSDNEARLHDAAGTVLTLRTTAPFVRCELVEGWESLHYLEKTSVPVVEIELRNAGMITTEVGWAP